MTELVDCQALNAQAQRLVEAARAAGADAADAIAIRSVNQVVSMRMGAVEKVEHSESESFGLRVFVGDRNATISASLGADVGVLADRVVAMARAAPADRFAGLLKKNRRVTRIIDWLFACVFSAFALKILTAQAK